MTTRLAPLPAPEGLRPARSGAAARAPAGVAARLASLRAPEGLAPAGVAVRLASLRAPGLGAVRCGAGARGLAWAHGVVRGEALG
jgi:hypothetical protein